MKKGKDSFGEPITLSRSIDPALHTVYNKVLPFKGFGRKGVDIASKNDTG
jgi:hypothetical protein